MQLLTSIPKPIQLRKTAGTVLIRIQVKELIQIARMTLVLTIGLGFIISLLITYYANLTLFWSLIKGGAIITMIGFLAMGSKHKTIKQ